MTLEGELIAQPTFKASVMEKLTIKRFLDFALKDLDFQLRATVAEMTPPALAIGSKMNAWKNQIRDIEEQGEMFKTYLLSLREGIDEMQEFRQEH